MEDRCSLRDLVWTPEGRGPLGDLGVDGKIILNSMRRHELVWDRTTGCCECGNEYSVPKMREDWGAVEFSSSNLLHDIALTRHSTDCQQAESKSLENWQQCLPVAGSTALFLQSTFRSPVRSVTSHQTDDAVNVTFLQTSTFFSTQKPRSYFAGLSLPGPLVDPQSLHVWTVVQQQQYQLSAAKRPQFYITFRPSFAIVICF
jgi:hypothetical protein